MEAKLGRQADALSFFRDLGERPYEFDFYQALRRIECLYGDRPRWGTALRPSQEPVRLGQEPSVTFAPASLSGFTVPAEGQPPRLRVHLFGLLGPNGPMPLNFTEFVRKRLTRQPSDPTLSRFLDLLHHRFIAMFYRAWAQAQPHVSHDRPDDDRYLAYVGSLVGVGTPALQHRDSIPDVARLFHAGTLIRQPRNADGLAAIVRQFFGVPAQVEEYVGHWMALGQSERTHLGRPGAILGGGAVAGRRIWDHQYKFRLHLGPLTLSEYDTFLPLMPGARPGPGATPSRLRQLVDWVRFYLGHELEWDVRLKLREAQVPPLRLGASGRLGWTTWLGTRTVRADADDLFLNAEFFVNRDRVA